MASIEVGRVCVKIAGKVEYVLKSLVEKLAKNVQSLKLSMKTL